MRDTAGVAPPQTAQPLDDITRLTYEERARYFKEHPEALRDWLLEGALVNMQHLQDLSQNPPSGRSGNQIQLGAIKEFNSLAEKVIGLVSAKTGAAAVDGEVEKEGGE
jgi:hypothetical protein